MARSLDGAGRPSSLNQTRGKEATNFARMAIAGLVQRKGFVSPLCSPMYELMAAWRSTIDRKEPRRMHCLARVEKKPSTALIQGADVGVKWNTRRRFARVVTTRRENNAFNDLMRV